MNYKRFYINEYKYNLTLTRVVFELVLVVIMYLQVVNLTLTRVVFEYVATGQEKGTRGNLTLTRVVFELRYSERSDRQK